MKVCQAWINNEEIQKQFLDIHQKCQTLDKVQVVVLPDNITLLYLPSTPWSSTIQNAYPTVTNGNLSKESFGTIPAKSIIYYKMVRIADIEEVHGLLKVYPAKVIQFEKPSIQMDFFKDTKEESNIDGNNYQEGRVIEARLNKYERNFAAREECLKHYGYNCFVCGFDSEDVYGEGVKIIEVHHINPISEYKEMHIIDPISDLRPVCPNCHSVIHSRTPPLDIDEIKKR